MNDKLDWDFSQHYSMPKANHPGLGTVQYAPRAASCGDCKAEYSKKSPSQKRCTACQSAAAQRTRERADLKQRKKRLKIRQQQATVPTESQASEAVT